MDTCNIIDKRIIPEFGEVKLKDITKMEVIMFMDDLEKDGKRWMEKMENYHLPPYTIFIRLLMVL